MGDNITSIRDPSISLTATSKLKSFYKLFKKEICSFKEPVPKNILDLDTEKDIMLKVSDIEWLNSYLLYKRGKDFSSDELLRGQSLDLEIKNLLNNKEQFNSLARYQSQSLASNFYLHELLDKSTLFLPRNEIIQRNPILAARVEKLKKEQDERAYKAMTRNVVTRKFTTEDTLAYELNMMNRHLIAVGQFIVSVGAGFAFGFLGTELIIGELEFGFRLLLGIACALIIALAEFYFLTKHLKEEEDVYSKRNAFSLNYTE